MRASSDDEIAGDKIYISDSDENNNQSDAPNYPATISALKARRKNNM